MPSTDYPYRIQGLRVNRREVLRYAFVAGVGLVAIPLIGCGEDEEKAKATSTPVATAAPPSGFFDSDGVKIHYETWGEGHPIVLVHGFSSNIEDNWVSKGTVDLLESTRWVVALDLRGHGQSDKPHDAAAYEGDTMPQDVLNLMDYLGIEKADLFGYSMGAFVCAALLARHRDRFTSVILGGVGDVFAGLNSETNRAIAEALLAEDPSTITNPIGLAFRGYAEAVGNNDLEALAAVAGNSSAPITRDEYAGLDIPVLVVRGEVDTVFTEAETTATADGIPGAKLIIIPGRGHVDIGEGGVFGQEVVAFLGAQ